MNINKIENLANIIVRMKIGVAVDSDREIFNHWLEERDENLKIYTKIMSGDFFASKFMMEDELTQIYDINKVKREILSKLRVRRNRKISSSIISYSIGFAACLALVLFGAKMYEYAQDKILLSQSVDVRKDRSAKIKAVREGDVVLITDKGEKIALTTEMDGIIANTTAKLDAQQVGNETISQNTIVTPKGTNYNIVLSDGTKVWMNESSRLIYPVSFSSEIREVQLIGEAYFEVEKSDSIPFIVKTNNSSIRVLGTKFNVNNSTGKTMTTLVEGSVEVVSPKNKIVILPSQQAVVADGNDRIDVTQVDVTIYTAWREGKYIFKNKPIEEIMQTLSSWYNISFEYDDDETAKINFSGTLYRDYSFDEIIDILEATKLFDVRIRDNNSVKLFKKEKYTE